MCSSHCQRRCLKDPFCGLYLMLGGLLMDAGKGFPGLCNGVQKNLFFELLILLCAVVWWQVSKARRMKEEEDEWMWPELVNLVMRDVWDRCFTLRVHLSFNLSFRESYYFILSLLSLHLIFSPVNRLIDDRPYIYWSSSYYSNLSRKSIRIQHRDWHKLLLSVLTSHGVSQEMCGDGLLYTSRSVSVLSPVYTTWKPNAHKLHDQTSFQDKWDYLVWWWQLNDLNHQFNQGKCVLPDSICLSLEEPKTPKTCS